MVLVGTSQYTIVDVGDGLDGKTIVALISNMTMSRVDLSRHSTSTSSVYFSLSEAMPDTTKVGDYVQIRMLSKDNNKHIYAIGTLTRITTRSAIYVNVSGYIDSGDNGAPGADGKNGTDGVGIRSVVSYYLISNSLTGVTTSTSGWSTTPKAPTISQKYLWLYTKTTMTDDKVVNSNPYVAGVYGDKGAPGVDGTTTYTWFKYADNEKGDNMSSNPAGKRYLGIAWNRPSATSSNNPADYTWTPMFGSPKIGGRNLSFFSNLVGGEHRSTFRNDGATASWTVPSNYGNGRGWGSSISLQYDREHEIVAYAGETIMFSFEVKMSRSSRLLFDVNNITRSFSGTKTSPENLNDNDDIPKRNTFTEQQPMNIPAGKWVRVSVSYTAKSDVDETVEYGSRICVHGVSGDNFVEVRRLMVELADTPSAYQPNPDEIQLVISEKVSVVEFERVQRLEADRERQWQDMQNLAKRLEQEVADWKLRYEQLSKDISDAKIAAANDAATMKLRAVAEVKDIYENRIDWNFINNSMSFSEEGIRIGAKDGSSYILVQKDRVSMFNGGSTPAMILSQNFIEIGSGVFTQNDKVGHYIEERLATTGPDEHINVIRYIP